MTLEQILGIAGGGGLLVVILGLIKVKPLEISVWNWIFRQIGKAFNSETLDYVKSIQACLDEHLQQHERTSAETSRQRILRFADEMYDNKYHSKESFEDILAIIDDYEEFSEAHPEFPNNRTTASAHMIKEQYKECMKKHDFDTKGRKNEKAD